MWHVAPAPTFPAIDCAFRATYSLRRYSRMSATYPPTRPERTGEPRDPYEWTMTQDTQVREYLIAVEQVKMMQEKLKQCYQSTGPNHFEDCKELREALWEKLNTPNYGAPGPTRSVRLSCMHLACTHACIYACCISENVYYITADTVCFACRVAERQVHNQQLSKRSLSGEFADRTKLCMTSHHMSS